jgi:diguanylate cyclase (GGDEF)-like protein/PAS domain S-box-containing protein
VLAFLFAGGGLLGLSTLVMVPPHAGTSVDGIFLPCVGGIAAAVLLYLCSARISTLALRLAVAGGTVMITVGLYFGSDIRTGGEIFYLWATVFAFYLMPLPVAFAEFSFVGFCYGLMLALRHEPTAAARWVVTIGTLLVAGLFLSRVVKQLESLFGRITNREEALRAAEEQFRSAFENAAIGMALVSLDGHWLRVNEALAGITGYSRQRLTGMSFRQLTPAEDLVENDVALAALVSGAQTSYTTEKRYLRADGATVWVSLSVSVVRDADGQPLHLISQMQDISARKAAEQELARRALHDPLTGLPNRLLFTDRVEVAVARSDRSTSPVAVFFVDLDRFKLVNDSLGHAIGDRLLVGVASRLATHIRPTDTISRFGGDEFTVLCEDADEERAGQVAERILKSLQDPFKIGEHELFVDASIGIAICRDPDTPAEAMLRDADAAMYLAKERGGSRFEIFHTGMRARATQRLELENDLRRAVENNEFELVFQPEVELESGSMTSVEALLRWRHPRRGLLTAAEFIDAAEESGLIVPIGEWVIVEACRHARLLQEGGHGLAVSINISPRQLANSSLAESLESAISVTGADPQLLTLEINESAAVRAPEVTLAQLRRLGIRLALDDFGSGLSSLNQIRSLPAVDSLKIDRLFIEQLGNDPTDNAIIAAIARMAAAMGVDTVAEGIETSLQAELVKHLGCDRGQGHHFGPPVTIEVLLRRLSSESELVV